MKRRIRHAPATSGSIGPISPGVKGWIVTNLLEIGRKQFELRDIEGLQKLAT